MQLKQLIDFVPGGVANKVVIKNHCGMSLLLALDAGAEIPPHSAPADVLVLVLEGHVDFTVGGQTNELKAGSYQLMIPNQIHSLKAQTPTKILVTKINMLPEGDAEDYPEC